MPYLRVAAIAVLLEAVTMPLAALMRRDMQFQDLAIVNIANTVSMAVSTVALAALGFSAMSFAWAWVISAAVSAILAVARRPDLWVLKPLFRSCRGMLVFGGYNGVNVFLYRIYEALPTMILGRVLSFDAAGLYNRSLFVCQMPDKIILAGAVPVILPVLSAEVRAGRDLKQPYLRAVELITALQWPALITLALLAHPVVMTVLGSQWLQTVPLIQVIALASLFSFTAELNYPVLISLGAMRDLLIRSLIAWPASALIIAAASFFGLHAVALSFIAIIPLQAYVSLYFVRRHIAMPWRELGGACWKSAAITACAAAGPLLVLAARGFHFDLSMVQTLLAGVLAAGGWLAGVWLTRHPFLDEIRLAKAVVRRALPQPG